MIHHSKISYLFLFLSFGATSFIHGMPPRKRARAATITKKERIGGRMGDTHEIAVYQEVPIYTPAPETYQYSFEIQEHGKHDEPITISLSTNIDEAPAAGLQDAMLTFDNITPENAAQAQGLIIYLVEFVHKNNIQLHLGKRVKLRTITAAKDQLLAAVLKESGFKQTPKEPHSEWALPLIID